LIKKAEERYEKHVAMLDASDLASGGTYGQDHLQLRGEIVEQSKEEYHGALKASSQGWHEGEHDIFPWVTHYLSVCRRAYTEFEERAERFGTRRGSKADLVEFALERMSGPFGIADVQRLCPGRQSRAGLGGQGH
jgi:hypothetical protein